MIETVVKNSSAGSVTMIWGIVEELISVFGLVKVLVEELVSAGVLVE